jgi:hypothetical protein
MDGPRAGVDTCRGAPADSPSLEHFHLFCRAVLTCPEPVAPAILSPVSARDIVCRPKSDSEPRPEGSEFYNICENAPAIPGGNSRLAMECCSTRRTTPQIT